MKKTLILLLFISVCACLHAQGNVFFTATVQEDPIYVAENEQPPICNWNNNYSVSFVKDHGKDIFCLINHSDFFNIYPSGTASAPACSIYHATVNLPGHLDYFYVNDIYIAEDYAFFCGSIYDTTKHKPYVLYGYFDLNDFFSDSLNINLDTITDGTTTAPVVLERLVAYMYDPECLVYKVVTYGYDDNYQYKVLEIDNATNPASTCSVADMPFTPGGSPLSIQLSDIFLEKSHVIVVEYNAAGYAGYTYGSRSSVVSDICNNNNHFISSSDETNGVVKGVALGANVFAFSYVHMDATTGQFYTRLRVIDLGNDANVFSYEFKKENKEDPIKMVYLSDLGTIELLQPIYDSADYIQLDPYIGSSYITTYLFPQGRQYNNLQRIGNQCYFSFHREKYFFLNRTSSTPFSTQSCPSFKEIEVNTITNESLMDIPNLCGNNLIGPIPIVNTINKKVPLDPQCYSFEEINTK